MSRRILVISIALTAVFGFAAVWFGMPWWRETIAVQQVTASDPEHRAEAWRVLTATGEGGEPPAIARLDAINRRLLDAPAWSSAAALMDAADHLTVLGHWGFDHQPPELILRECAARIAFPEQQMIAVERLETCPLSPGLLPYRQFFDALLASPREEVRRATLRAALRWAGPNRPDMVSALAVPEQDAPLLRAQLLALAFSEGGGTAPQLDLDAEQPVEVIEALLLHRVKADPTDVAPVIELEEQWDDLDLADGDRPAFAAILRYSPSTEATRCLQRLARAGDTAATYALQVRSASRDQAQSAKVAKNATEPSWRRRLAAWRWPNVPTPTVRTILAGDPTEVDGSVYSTALLVERYLDRDAAVELAEEWIRSFNDDHKRAGALLAALLGAHGELLASALVGEDVATVRTAQQLALHALGHRVEGGDPVEFAHRALHRDDGDFDPDVACYLLLAGHAPTTELLTTAPNVPRERYGSAVRQRVWLIERFVPHWHDALGRPLGADRRSLQLYLDSLSALGQLTGRRLRFDAGPRIYAVSEGPAPIDSTGLRSK